MVVGDSYTAGNGAIDSTQNLGYYFKSADDPRPDEAVRQPDPNDSTGSRGCFRNHNSWGEQVKLGLQASAADVGSFVNAACGGDTTENLVGVNEPPQLAGFSEAQRNEVDLIALTIGGNDLGFGQVVAWCFATTLAGQTCDEKLRDAEDMIEPANGQYSIIQALTLAALNKLKHDWPNAKIVLVGYPLFWEDETYTLEVCPGCGGSIEAGARLEEGLNTLNAQQQTLIDDLNSASPGRFAFMPLHEEDNQGFFDGHGLEGNETLWINPLEIVSDHPEGRAHPNLEGHAAIADHLVNLPLVQQVVNEAIRRDYPRMSLSNIDDRWYALDANGTLWKVTAAFVQCQLPDGPYKLVSWRESEQLFTAAVNQAPYPDLPSQPGCDLSAPQEGDMLRGHLGAVWDNQYWGVTFGPGGEPRRVLFSGSDRVACRLQRGARVFDIQLSNMEALYEDVTGSATVPGGEGCWEGEIVTTDIYGRLWMGHSGLGPSGLTSNLVTSPWFETCLRLRGIEIHNIDYWDDPSYSNIMLDYSGWTDAQCIDGDPQMDPLPHP